MAPNPYESPAEAPSAEANPASDRSAATRIVMKILVLIVGIGIPIAAGIATYWHLFDYGHYIAYGLAVFTLNAVGFGTLVITLPICEKYGIR